MIGKCMVFEEEGEESREVWYMISLIHDRRSDMARTAYRKSQNTVDFAYSYHEINPAAHVFRFPPTNMTHLCKLVMTLLLFYSFYAMSKLRWQVCR